MLSGTLVKIRIYGTLDENNNSLGHYTAIKCSVGHLENKDFLYYHCKNKDFCVGHFLK